MNSSHTRTFEYLYFKQLTDSLNTFEYALILGILFLKE